jgi:hypothetical protein
LEKEVEDRNRQARGKVSTTEENKICNSLRGWGWVRKMRRTEDDVDIITENVTGIRTNLERMYIKKEEGEGEHPAIPWHR